MSFVFAFWYQGGHASKAGSDPGKVFFGGLGGGVHHVEGEGEAGGFEVEAVVIDFLSSVRIAVIYGKTYRWYIPERID